MKNKFKISTEIIQIICKKYDLGYFISFAITPEGENINFVLTTSKGKFLAKIFIQEDSESEKIVYYEQSLFEYLRSKNFSLISEILKTPDGYPFIRIKGKLCVVYSFIEGTNKFENEDIYIRQIANTLGLYHSIVRNYKPDFCASKYPFTPRILYRILYKETDFDYLNDSIFIQKIKSEFRSIYNIKTSGLSSGTVHGDIDPQNFIFNKNNLKVMIDFGDSFYGVFLIDICRGIYELCFDSGTKCDIAKMQFFLNEYESQRKLSLNEKQYLKDYIKFAFCWKITDGLKSKKSSDWLKKRLDTLNQFMCEYLNKLSGVPNEADLS